jgi:hypothetical protein
VGVSGFYVAPGTTNGLIDYVGTPLSFDALAPGYTVQGGGDAALGYVAKPGTALVVTRNATSAAADNALGLLAIEHHNAAGDRANVVKVEDARPGNDRQPIGAGHR